MLTTSSLPCPMGVHVAPSNERGSNCATSTINRRYTGRFTLRLREVLVASAGTATLLRDSKTTEKD